MNGVVSFFEGLGQYVFAWSWQLAVLVSFLGILLRLDRKHRPELRRNVLALSLVLALALPWTPQKLASLSWMARVKAVFLNSFTVSAKQSEPSGGLTPAEPSNLDVATATVTGPQPLTLGRREMYSEPTGMSIVGFLWVVGVFVVAFRKFGEHRRLRAVARRAATGSGAELELWTSETTDLPVLLSGEVRSPLLFGWVRPVVLLPDRFTRRSTPEQRHLIVCHEYVHFRWKDHWFSTLETVIRTVLFFHPMARWMCRQFDIERELACDAEVLRLGSDPKSYAETLLSVAEHALVGEGGVYFAAAEQLDRRVEFLFRAPSRTATAVLISVCSLLLMPLVAMGGLQAEGEPFLWIEPTFERRLLPSVPVEARSPVLAVPILKRATAPSSPPISQEPALAVVPPPTPASRPQVTILKGRGSENEVRIALPVPHSSLTFSQFRSGLVAGGRYDIEISKSGRVEGHVDVPFEISMPGAGFRQDAVSVLQKAFLLEPGRYRLRAAITEEGKPAPSAVFESEWDVPLMSSNLLEVSSLVVADIVEVGNGRSNIFRIGNVRVRPSVTGNFRKTQELHTFQQVYAPATDGQGSLRLDTLITLDGREFRRISEELERAAEIDVIKSIPLADFPSGSYAIRTTVTNPATGQGAVSSAQFTVE